jgi:hypothetical protein
VRRVLGQIALREVGERRSLEREERKPADALPMLELVADGGRDLPVVRRGGEPNALTVDDPREVDRAAACGEVAEAVWASSSRIELPASR